MRAWKVCGGVFSALWIMLTAPASADTVLMDGSGFIEGTQSFEQSFDLKQAGTLLVTLNNINWPAPLATLDLLVSTTSGMLAGQPGEASALSAAFGTNDSAGASNVETFAVKPGMVFAQWYGTAQGPLDTGVYSMKVDFIPAGAVVPLPKSIALLLSGLALLAWQRRQRIVDAPEGAIESTACRSEIDLHPV